VCRGVVLCGQARLYGSLVLVVIASFIEEDLDDKNRKLQTSGVVLVVIGVEP